MRLLITAGPTREPIDEVRYITNRSSGKLGVAVARAAAQRGHEVTLLLGPVNEPVSNDGRLRVYRFESSAELWQMMEAHWADHDALVMAAAVCDYRPATVHEGKQESDKGQAMTLTLLPTPDLVAQAAAMKRAKQRVVAFALEEPAKLRERALEKLRRKGVDAIVANPLGTMDAQAITATWLRADGQSESPGTMSKTDFGPWLVSRVEALLQ
jgi:phosphopantothenoylcysteine decarboxylase / phosphopantothenate---cysteine ligase